jgi:hypothetical protein
LKITLLELKKLVENEMKTFKEAKFTKLGYGRPELQGPRSLGPIQRGGGDDPVPEQGEEISIWYNGDWHDTILTVEEHEAIHDAWDQELGERYSDVVERVLSSMRDLDIEDVEL